VFGKSNSSAINLSAIISNHTQINGTIVGLTKYNIRFTCSWFVINGEAAGDRSGWSVSSAGDVNGDGLHLTINHKAP
jgi:hypothetical protein